MRRSFPLALACLGVLMMPRLSLAQAVTPNSVRLNWTAVGDDSLVGVASTYDVRYSTSPISAGNWASATQATGEPTPVAAGTRQTFTVSGLQPQTTYYFAIKTGDEVPNWSGLSNVISATTLAAPDTTRPAPVASLQATSSTGTSISLSWNAVGDDSLTGTATSYDIRYSTAPITAANWNTATQVTGEPAPAAPGTAQSMTVNGLANQTTYYLAMKVSDDAGNVSALSNVVNRSTLDTIAPASITDLAVGWIWLQGTGGEFVASTGYDGRAPRQGR